MLLELFDRIFGSKETKLTYQVRDAIANRADNVLNVLLNGTNAEATRVRDELRQHVEEKEDLLNAIRTQDAFRTLRTALGIQEPAPVIIVSPLLPPLTAEPAAEETAAPLSAEPLTQAPAESVAQASTETVDFDADAKAKELESFKSSKDLPKLLDGLRDLETGQLTAVLQMKPDLLKGFSQNFLEKIIEGKDADFLVVALTHADPVHVAFLLLRDGERNSQTKSIFADTTTDQLVEIFNIIPSHLISFAKGLHPSVMEKLRETTIAALLMEPSTQAPTGIGKNI